MSATLLALLIAAVGIAPTDPRPEVTTAAPSSAWGYNTETSSARASFGGSILLHENTLLVSEPTGFRYPGQVHVVKQQGTGAWSIAQSLQAPDGVVGDRFGNAVAATGDLLLIGAPGTSGGEGRAFLFRRGLAGSWTLEAGLKAPTPGPSRGFGSAVAFVGRAAVVGAPGEGDGAGAAHAFILNAGEWVPVATLGSGDGDAFGTTMAGHDGRLAVTAAVAADGAGRVHLFDWDGTRFAAAGQVTGFGAETARFGAALALSGDRLAIGAPGSERLGEIALYLREGREWVLAQRLAPPEGVSGRAGFGTALQLAEGGVWVSAPGAGDSGQVFWLPVGGTAQVIEPVGVNVRAGFGNSFAATDSFLAVGAAADAYGEGTAFFFRRDGSSWLSVGSLYNPQELPDEVSGSEVECADGDAGGYDCESVDLLAFLPNDQMEINRGVRLNDIWGWTDPETGKEYALVGHMEAMAFVDVSNPTGPVYLGTLPRTEGSPGSTWRDIKVYRDHAFIVADGAGAHGMQVFDLRRLRSLENTPVQFEPDYLYTGIASAHNIVINEDTGFAYTVGNSSGGETCGGGLHMIDIREPRSPAFVGCFTHMGTASGGGGSTHDAQCVTYSGPDSDHAGREVCVSANGAALSVADVTDKTNPRPISAATYPNHAYVHQGWFTDDQRYFFQNDEGDETSGVVDRTRTLIWDMTDLDDPQMVGEFYGPTNATDHNLYVDGHLMYQTNNSSGLRIIDISNPESPVEVGHFDTTPYGNDNAGFNGTWSSYPYFGSGTLVVTSRREGLFLVRKRSMDT